MHNVYLDNNYLGKMNIAQIIKKANSEKLNVIINKSNGYSHDWQEVVDFSIDIFHEPHIYLTHKPIGRIFGSSIVSFS
ncbi:MAG: hypothetical protein IPO78_17235 [Saprospiraceae bacterium]|nr:hypothetical protein [Saprospiraceae bacterium]